MYPGIIHVLLLQALYCTTVSDSFNPERLTVGTRIVRRRQAAWWLNDNEVVSPRPTPSHFLDLT
jgi:hypothetical protein